LDIENILKSFKQPEDKLFIQKVLDQAYLCLKNHIYTFTDFIDMHQYGQVMKIINQLPSDLSYQCFGGYDNAERKMIGFSPFYLSLEVNDFPIQALEFQNRSATHYKMSHRDYLGVIIKTGIDRSKIGDILVKNDGAIVFLNQSISSFIQFNVTKVGKCAVQLKPLDLDKISIPKPKVKEIHASVASLRVDALLSSGFSISRGKAVQFIKRQKVFKNWILVENPAENVQINDILTLRGLGRIKLVYIGNKTRKNRIHVTIYRYV